MSHFQHYLRNPRAEDCKQFFDLLSFPALPSNVRVNRKLKQGSREKEKVSNNSSLSHGELNKLLSFYYIRLLDGKMKMPFLGSILSNKEEKPSKVHGSGTRY